MIGHPAAIGVQPVEPLARMEASARLALALCADADRVAVAAGAKLGLDDDELFALLDQRERTLDELTQALVALRSERPSADTALHAATRRVIDAAERMIADVCGAVAESHRVTTALGVRVAARVEELRAELTMVQQAGSAAAGYAVLPTPRSVDRIR